MNAEVRVRTSKGMRLYTIDDTFLQSLSENEQRNKRSITLFVTSFLSLLSDSPLRPYKPPTVFSKFLADLKKDGVKVTIIRFTSLAHKLVSQPTGHKDSLIGPWIEGFKDTPFFKEYLYFYRTGNVNVLSWLYTVLNFGKKLEYVDPSFDEVAFRDWIHNEERLRDLVLPQDHIESLRLILQETLPPLNITDFRPGFGPGSVSERGIRRRIDKLGKLNYDPILDRVFFHGHIGKYGYGKESGLTAESVIPDTSLWTPVRGVSSRESRLMFVPKNIKTSRSICMEPNTLMFFQQGVLSEFSKMIRSSVLGKFIRLDDQSFNVRLSQLGSSTGLIDTLDLSSASDCLSYSLIKSIFPNSWQIVMRSTRSSHVILPNKEKHLLMKYAPMGSALCFPSQCIIFWAVSILAACHYSYELDSPCIPFALWLTPNKVHQCITSFGSNTLLSPVGFQPLGIYGDDICIDTRLSKIVISILTSLGFLVNEDKSFFGDQLFRESCGGFFMKGYDISPLYFTVKGVRDFITPEHVSSQVSLLNRAWDRQYRNLYRFLRSSIMTWGSERNPIPHVSDPRFFGIRCTLPSNNHLERRYNPNYQRDEVRGWTITYTEKYHCGNLLGALDKYEYMRWWSNHREAEAPTDFSSSVLRYDTGKPGLRWRWIPA